jgi:hypothetical protein
MVGEELLDRPSLARLELAAALVDGRLDGGVVEVKAVLVLVRVEDHGDRLARCAPE